MPVVASFHTVKVMGSQNEEFTHSRCMVERPALLRNLEQEAEQMPGEVPRAREINGRR